MVSEPLMDFMKDDSVATRFDGKNYALWEHQFRVHVQGKALLSYLKGEAVIPESPTAPAATKDSTPPAAAVDSTPPTAVVDSTPPTAAGSSEAYCCHCSEKGHTTSHCKKRNFCNCCKTPGHIILDCPTLRNREKKSASR
ncbi:hypothetical protein LINGRAHAP2_LOCUS27887, partial [Linum grandiflorum]